MPIRTDSGLKLTYEDYAQIEEDGRRHEILDGAHYVNPAPTPRHQTVSRRIQFQLYEQLERTGRAEVYNAPIDVELSRFDIAQPDLVVVSRARAAIVTESRILGTPDLLVEILSPSTSKVDRGLKRERYAKAGVPEYWIVDPRERVVEQFVLGDGELRLREQARERIVPAVFPDVAVDLTQVW